MMEQVYGQAIEENMKQGFMGMMSHFGSSGSSGSNGSDLSGFLASQGNAQQQQQQQHQHHQMHQQQQLMQQHQQQHQNQGLYNQQLQQQQQQMLHQFTMQSLQNSIGQFGQFQQQPQQQQMQQQQMEQMQQQQMEQMQQQQEKQFQQQRQLLHQQLKPEPGTKSAELNTMTIKDIHTYKEVREKMVELLTNKRLLSKRDFDQLYMDLRRTQDFARQVSLPEKEKLIFKDSSQAKRIGAEAARNILVQQGLVAEKDDDNLVKFMIWRQYLMMQPGYVTPSFADVRQWIGMIYRNTLQLMAEETTRFKNSKPRTRSELFLRLYLLAKICGLELEFHHTDFRSQ